MKNANPWVVAAALVVGAVLLTTVASTSASAVTGAPAFQDQQDRPPMPPPGGPGGMGPGGPGGPGGGLEMLLFELDLTSAQSERIKALQDESWAATRTYQDKIRTAEEAIGTAVQAAAFDENAVRTQATAIASATAEMKVIQARTHAAIWKLLTADQQSQLKQLLAERKPEGSSGPGLLGGPERRRCLSRRAAPPHPVPSAQP